ncbi:hypothetical protein [Polaromonas sp. YR568]|uniref:hypothetical protein n=1 Tax=Polaromonas sp. YR568 TaxID=1855301 RepID=UPI00398C0738
MRAYGDTALALYIGDEDNFDAVGVHSWEALCKDCGFRLPETLKGFRKMAQDIMPAWQKTKAALIKDLAPAARELELLEKITGVFEMHSAHALSMTGR